MTEFWSWYVHASLSEVSSWVVLMGFLWLGYELTRGGSE